MRQLKEVYGEEAFEQYVKQNQEQEEALYHDLAKEKKRDEEVY